jgi:hypothetical protein
MELEDKRGKLTDEQVNLITARLNAVINVRLVPEWAEGLAIKAAVMGVDYFILRSLGNEVYELIFSLGAGVEDEAELNALIIRLATLANEKLNVPILNEEQEQKFFVMTVSMIVAALAKGRDINVTIAQDSGLPAPPIVPDPGRPEEADIDETDLSENHGSVG